VALSRDDVTPTTGSFDRFAADYERLLDDPLRHTFAGDSTFFIAQKCRVLWRHLERELPSTDRRRVLDAGCGLGTAVGLLRGECNAIGSDVSFSMLGHAVRHGPVVVQEPFDLPFRSAAFDAAFAFCVYHHIEELDRSRHLREVARVVRPGGLVFVFEHNPLNPVTRLVFHRAPVDRGCRLIARRTLSGLFREAGLLDIRHGYVLFLPEALQGAFGAVEPHLEWLPLGGQYYVCGRKG
jgi:SAM-dependent methyltransferase